MTVDHFMSLLLANQPFPLQADANGMLRVADTRVTLDAIIAVFKKGATAEQIVHNYPILHLADIYAVITFYLREPESLDAYIAEQHLVGQPIRH